MPARLYTVALSHPGLAAEGMLRHKGLPHAVTTLVAGAHPVALKALGFAGVTVPALRFEDGRRVQGTLRISQALEAEVPEPSLYGGGAAAIRTAEVWGEEVLQSVPRRLLRRSLADSLAQRRWFADVASPFPAPAITGALLTPVVPVFVRQAGATRDRIAQDVAELPGLLDEVDALIADGILDGPELNAADFQIGTSTRMLLAMADVAPMLAGRPAERHARRVLPDYPPIPPVLAR